MPWNVGTKTISRVWAFVDRFAPGQTADRDEFDAGFDDLAESVNGALAYYDGRVAALEVADEWYIGVSPTDPTAARDGGPLVSGMFYVRSPELSLRVLDAGEFRQVRAIGNATPYSAALLEATNEEEAGTALGLGDLAYESTVAFARLTANNTFSGRSTFTGGIVAPLTVTGYSEDAATGGLLQIARARGSAAAPSAVLSNDALGVLKARGYSAGAFTDAFEARVVALSATSPFSARLTLNLSGSTVFTLLSNGNLTLAGALDAPSATLGSLVMGATLSRVLTAAATLTLPTIDDGAEGSATVTLTGAAAGDQVMVQLPAIFPAGLILSRAAVTAANTVTCYAFNASGSSIAGAAYAIRATALRLA